MTTIFAIMLCYYGQCRMDPYNQTFRTLAECQRAKAIPERAMRGGPVRYICVKKAMPTWQPAE